MRCFGDYPRSETPRDKGAAGGANALGVQGEGFDGEREYELARAQMKSVEAGIENIMSFSVGGKTGLEGKEE